MSKFLTFVAAVAVATLSAGPAFAEKGDIVVKAGVMGVLPNEDDSAGLNLEITDEVLPSLQIEYFFTDNISVEALCCLAPHSVSAPALGPVADVTLFPPTVTAKYHFSPDAAFSPYVGAGVNYTSFFDEDVKVAGFRSIDLDDSFGAALQVGADFPINDRWLINVDARRVWIESETTLTPNAGAPLRFDVTIDPWIVSASVGYRF